MAKTILVADDEDRIVALVKAYLEKDGFRVVTAGDGRHALFVARHEKPDLIILDIMMPELDGHEFMRLHRREQATPIILLTARVEEHDRVLGLELGADDYVTKPFSPRELAARVRAVLRRAEQLVAPSPVVRAGPFVLDPERFEALRDDRRLDLTRYEFELLATLMGAPGRVFSRADLLDRLQGGTGDGNERTIDVHIRNLRSKIEDDARRPRYIETVYGVGYRFSGG